MTHNSYSILKLNALNVKPRANMCLKKHCVVCKLNNRTIYKFSLCEEPTVYLDMFAGYLAELLKTAVRTVQTQVSVTTSEEAVVRE